MKKLNTHFLITAISLLIAWLLIAAFALGTVNAPSEYWLPTARGVSGTDDVQNAFVTVDIDRHKTYYDEESEEYVEGYVEINSIYVFIGRAYTYDKEGNVVLNFDFKTQSASMAESYNKRVVAKVPAYEGGSRYGWIKVYDAKESGELGLSYSRVKIQTPHSFEFYEVAFADGSGEIFKISTPVVEQSNYGKEDRDNAKYLTDEQSTFSSSSSRIYSLTDKECNELSAVNSFLSGNGLFVGEGPLSTLIMSLGVLIFGRNTFGIRIMPFLASYVLLLLLYSLIKSIFGKKNWALLSLLMLISAGSVFSAAVTSSAALISACFMVACIKFVADYFGRRYLPECSSSGAKDIALAGLFYGLGVCAYPAYILFIIPVAVLFVLAFYREYKEYKFREKEAKGLDKESVYQAHRKLVNTLTWLIPLCLVVAPVALLIACYGAIGANYTAYYVNSFFGAMAKDINTNFGFSLNAFGLLIGVGSENLGGGHYAFLNYPTCVLGLCSLVFTSIVVFFGKNNAKLSRMRSGILNKYKILGLAFLGSFIAMIFSAATVRSFSLTSVFYSAFIPLAIVALSKTLNPKKIKVITVLSSAVCLVVFAMGFLGYLGIAIPDLASAILYGWQI